MMFDWLFPVYFRTVAEDTVYYPACYALAFDILALESLE